MLEIHLQYPHQTQLLISVDNVRGVYNETKSIYRAPSSDDIIFPLFLLLSAAKFGLEPIERDDAYVAFGFALAHHLISLARCVEGVYDLQRPLASRFGFVRGHAGFVHSVRIRRKGKGAIIPR